MRFAIKQQMFKSKRCEFNIGSMEAWSYRWWKFVECRNGRVYFNGAQYSMQTGKQQGIVSDLLKDMGIKYHTLYIKAGLHNIKGEIENIKHEIEETLSSIANPRSRKATNKDRTKRIQYLKNQITRLEAYNKLKVETKYIIGFQARKHIESVLEKQREKTIEKVVKVNPVVQSEEVQIQSVPSWRESARVIQGDKLLTGYSRAKLTLIQGGKC